MNVIPGGFPSKDILTNYYLEHFNETRIFDLKSKGTDPNRQEELKAYLDTASRRLGHAIFGAEFFNKINNDWDMVEGQLLTLSRHQFEKISVLMETIAVYEIRKNSPCPLQLLDTIVHFVVSLRALGI